MPAGNVIPYITHMTDPVVSGGIDLDSDTIVAVTVLGLATSEQLSGTPTVVAGTGITVKGSPAPAISGGNVVVFWLTGGTAGQVYQGEIRCGTNQGRTIVVSWDIHVLDLAPNA